MTQEQIDKLILIAQGLVLLRDEFRAGLWDSLRTDERTLIETKLDSAIAKLNTAIMLEEALMAGREQ